MNEYDDQNNNVNNIGLVISSFKNNSIRIIDSDGEPWFVLADVIKAMGTSRTTAQAKKSIYKGLGEGLSRTCITTDGMGRQQEATIINESAVTFLLINSKIGKSGGLLEKIINQVKNAKSLLEALDDFDVPDNYPESYVYAVRETETGRIKLGVSDNPERRVKELQTANSQKLELVAYRKAYDRVKAEKALHNKAASYHIRGEWFTSEAEKLLDEEEDDKNLT